MLDIQGIVCNYSILHMNCNCIHSTHMQTTCTACTYLNAEQFSKSRTHWLNMTQHSAILPAQGSEGVRQAQKSKADLSLHMEPCWSCCVAILQWLRYVGIMLGCNQDEPIGPARNAQHVCVCVCIKGLKGGTGSLQISCSLQWGQIRAMPLVPIRRMACQWRLWSHETWNLKVRAPCQAQWLLALQGAFDWKNGTSEALFAALQLLHKQSQWQCSSRSWSVAKETIQKASTSNVGNTCNLWRETASCQILSNSAE